MKERLLLLIFWFLFAGMLAQGKPVTENLGSKLKRGNSIGREPDTEEKNVTVYPNPASGLLNLSLSGFGGRKTNVSIMNVIGTVVYQETLISVDSRYTRIIDVSKFTHGLYYIKLQADDYSEIRKVVLK